MPPTSRLSLLAVIFMVLVSACAGEGDGATITEPAIPSTVTGGSVAVPAEAPATTATAETTLPPTTTTLPTATTTTPPTTVAVTTTTTEPAPATTLSETYFYLELRPGGLGDANFGDDETSVIAYVTEVLGAPASDTGWVNAIANFGVCPSDATRVVSWTTPGKFDLYFYEGGTTFTNGLDRHFGHYWYHGPDVGAFGVFTPDGVTVGSTVLTLINAYGPDLQISESFLPGAYFWKVDTNPADSEALGGWTTGEADDSILESIYGGIGCGE